MRPTMRFVPVKASNSKICNRFIARVTDVWARTALINHFRGLLGEYGIVLPQGPWRFEPKHHGAIADAELSDLARATLQRSP